MSRRKYFPQGNVPVNYPYMRCEPNRAKVIVLVLLSLIVFELIVSEFFFDHTATQSSFKVGREPEDNESGCLLRSYQLLCMDFRGIDAHHCHHSPREFLERQFSEYIPTEKEIRAKKLLRERHKKLLSIGAGKSNVCDDIMPNETLCTDVEDLDLLKLNSWFSLLQSASAANGDSYNQSVIYYAHDSRAAVPYSGFEVIFAEHVLEHFTPVQVQKIAATAFAVLRPGGVFRIAVPDGYKPSPSYQLYIRPGGTPSGGGQNHMVAWTVDNFPSIFSNVGFIIILREHFDIHGSFHTSQDAYAADQYLGRVNRSWRHDARNKKPYMDFSIPGGQPSVSDLQSAEPMFTSLWFDAVKPVSCDEVVSGS